MDSIKKKMQSLAKETSNAEARAVRSEEEVKRINDTADSYEENVKQLQKKIQATEGQFDVCTEDLFNQTIKLEEMEKKAGNAEVKLELWPEECFCWRKMLLDRRSVWL